MTSGLQNSSLGPRLSAADFRKFCQLAYRVCGIKLQEGKEDLVAARLLKVMRAAGIDSFQDYYRFVEQDCTGEALEELIDTLTTHHTGFFREAGHFDYFTSNILPEIQNRRRISIWSAACATGEEPYSIAFSLLDRMGEPALRQCSILATDVSTRVLARARRGLFEGDRVSNLAGDYLRRYFQKGAGRWSGWFMVKRAIREQVEFRRFNLVNEFSPPGQFPLIFCRNVMIYFDAPTQARLVQSLTRCLEPGGYLFIGYSESLGGIPHDLESVAPAIYRRPGKLIR